MVISGSNQLTLGGSERVDCLAWFHLAKSDQDSIGHFSLFFFFFCDNLFVLKKKLQRPCEYADLRFTLPESRFHIGSSIISIAPEQTDMDDAALSAALVAAVRELFKGPNRDQLSVNNVRKQVEEEHGLDSGFFAGAEWKGRSKTLIKETVVRYSIVLP